MNINVTEIIIIIIAMAAVVAGRYIKKYLDFKLTDDQKVMVTAAVKTFVYAAEQLQKSGALTIPKKEWVLQRIEDWLAKNGIEVDMQWIDSVIESTVCEINLEKQAI